MIPYPFFTSWHFLVTYFKADLKTMIV